MNKRKFLLGGAAATTVATKNASGSIAYANGGYTFTRGAAWQGDMAYFTVNLGTGKQLSDYQKVTLKVLLTGDAGYKKVALLVAENMATAVATISDDASVGAASVTKSGEDWSGPQLNFETTALDVELTIDPTRAAVFNGKQQLGMSFFCNGNATQVMTVTDVVFVLK
jgi:hypothetical protein